MSGGACAGIVTNVPGIEPRPLGDHALHVTSSQAGLASLRFRIGGTIPPDPTGAAVTSADR